MKEILQKDYENRKSDFSVDEDEYSFILKLNKKLKTIEKYQEGIENYNPFIFIFGVPRTGTTILTQLLSYSLDVGYINNIIARFWLAPLTGIKLSKILIGNTIEQSYKSEYGRTYGLSGRHEFAYFWQYWLNKEKIKDSLLVNQGEERMNWPDFNTVMLNIQNEFGKTMVFKNIIGANHLNKISEVLKKTLWIYIDRDPIDTAVSIFKARKRINYNVNQWWSTYPPEYYELKDMPYFDQIAGQIFYLKQLYESQIRNAAFNNVIRFSYIEVCENPINIINSVIKIVKEKFNVKIDVRSQPPRSFDISRSKNDFPEYKYLIKGLEKFNLI